MTPKHVPIRPRRLWLSELSTAMVDSIVDKMGIRSWAGWPRFEIGTATDGAIANVLQGERLYQQSQRTELVDELKVVFDHSVDFAG